MTTRKTIPHHIRRKIWAAVYRVAVSHDDTEDDFFACLEQCFTEVRKDGHWTRFTSVDELPADNVKVYVRFSNGCCSTYAELVRNWCWTVDPSKDLAITHFRLA